MKKYLIAFVLYLFLIHAAHANKWETGSSGYWNSSGVWLGGIVPPYSSSDTFIIKHPVLLNATLTLNAGAYLQIDSTGGICGHQKINVNTKAKITTYGILELDSLFIPGGDVDCLVPGIVTLTYNGFISNGGHMFVNCSLSVGPWFNCHMPEYAFTMGVPSANPLPELSVFPNPCSSGTTLQAGNSLHGAILAVYNSVGQQVKQIKNISGRTITLSRDNLPGGLYFLRITQDSKVIATNKLVILDN